MVYACAVPCKRLGQKGKRFYIRDILYIYVEERVGVKEKRKMKLIQNRLRSAGMRGAGGAAGRQRCSARRGGAARA